MNNEQFVANIIIETCDGHLTKRPLLISKPLQLIARSIPEPFQLPSSPVDDFRSIVGRWIEEMMDFCAVLIECWFVGSSLQCCGVVKEREWKCARWRKLVDNYEAAWNLCQYPISYTKQ